MELATAFNDAWHRQPDPANRPDGRRPSNPQWVLVSAVWLLAAWTPASTPGWASTLVLNETADRSVEPWPAPPGRLAAIADLPETTGAVPYAGTPAEDDHVTPPEELVSLIATAAHVHDARRTSLVRYLANEAAGRYGDLLRLTTTDDDPALHLLRRDCGGSTVRISFAPAPTVQQPPVIAEAGADSAVRTRLSCIATLLSDLLMVNNNNPVDFRFRIGMLPGTGTHDDRLAAATRWWSATREDAEEYAGEEPAFRPITFAELRTSLHHTARLSLVDIWDGSWDGIDAMPEIPSGHVVTHLVDDLVDVIEARLGGALVAVHGYLPTGWPPVDPTGEDEDGEYTYVLFVRGEEVGVLDIDQAC